MNVSINPSYYCNFRCNFCYLTEQQLSDKTLLSTGRIRDLMLSISKNTQITSVDIYGGEICLLPEKYLNELIDGCLEFTSDVNLVTNLSHIHSSFLRDDVTISVSYDFDAREKHELVFQNMMKLSRPYSIIVLVTPLVLQKAPADIINIFNSVASITDVELKPYSSNQANSLKVTNYQFDQYVIEWLQLLKQMRFNFINANWLDSVLSKTRNMYSDDHLYITPNGHLSVLSFDSNSREYFQMLNDFNEYESWCEKEKQQVLQNNH